MWIMLTKKLPTQPSPPKMSIHWATPWPGDNKYVEPQRRAIAAARTKNNEIEPRAFGIEDPETATFYDAFGQEPNWIGAMRIHYHGVDLRVFPHEMSRMTLAKLKYYVTENEIYDLVDEDVVAMPIAKMKMDPDQRQIYDSALLDGCNPSQATMVMLGIDVSDDEVEFPPVGWYRLHEEYANIFCYAEEQEEE